MVVNSIVGGSLQIHNPIISGSAIDVNPYYGFPSTDHKAHTDFYKNENYTIFAPATFGLIGVKSHEKVDYKDYLV